MDLTCSWCIQRGGEIPEQCVIVPALTGKPPILSSSLFVAEASSDTTPPDQIFTLSPVSVGPSPVRQSLPDVEKYPEHSKRPGLSSDAFVFLGMGLGTGC
jgi:hypothetical protein